MNVIQTTAEVSLRDFQCYAVHDETQSSMTEVSNAGFRATNTHGFCKKCNSEILPPIVRCRHNKRNAWKMWSRVKYLR